jgi:dTMP kinase
MLVVVEGCDGTGKATQAKRLYDRYAKIKENEGYEARPELLSFPAYNDTFMGPMIKRYLKGEMGSLYQNHPFLVAMLYAIDRYESPIRSFGAPHIPAHKLIICDRYIHSNVAHQCAKLVVAGRGWRKLATDIMTIEATVLELPQPDLVIYLDMPVEQACHMARTRDGARDLHQDNLEYMQAVRDIYRELAADASWYQVNCYAGTERRTADELHEEIFSKVDECYLAACV